MAEGIENIGLDVFDEQEVLRQADPQYQTSTDSVGYNQAETSFNSPQVDRLTQLRVESTQQKVEQYLRAHNITDPGAKTDLRLNARIGPDGKLYYNDIRLEKTRGTGFLAEESLKGVGVADFKRNVLHAPSEQAITNVFNKEDVLNLKVPAEDMTPKNIGTLRDELKLLRMDASGNADKIQTIEARIDEWNNKNPEYKTFVNELSLANKRLADLYAERDKILSPGPDGSEPELTPELHEQLAKLENRIEFLHDQRTIVNEKLATTRSLSDVIKDPDLTLRLKLTELFRRKGLTIGAIITAIGMTISTIALAVSRGSGGGGGGNRGDSEADTPYTKAKQIVKQFGKWLKALAAKSTAAIPGLIGTIVSFILKAAGGAVTFIGEQLWIFITALTFFVINRLV